MTAQRAWIEGRCSLKSWTSVDSRSLLTSARFERHNRPHIALIPHRMRQLLCKRRQGAAGAQERRSAGAQARVAVSGKVGLEQMPKLAAHSCSFGLQIQSFLSSLMFNPLGKKPCVWRARKAPRGNFMACKNPHSRRAQGSEQTLCYEA